MRCRSILACLLLLSCLPLVACMKKVRVDPVPEPDLRPLAMDAKVQPITIYRLTLKMRRGEVYGTAAYDGLCIPRVATSALGERTELTRDELAEVFMEEAGGNGFKVVGDTRALFDDPDRSRANLWVGGNISEIRKNICFPMHDWGNPVPSKGEANLMVDWEVFSPVDRQVVLRRTTTGYGKLDSATEGGGAEVLRMAFAHATRGLLADEEFRKLVTMPAGSAYVAPQLTQTQEARPVLTDVRVQVAGPDTPRVPLDSVRHSAVLVQMGDSHGSGFVVTDDGYILTNYHVVEESERARVRFQSGASVVTRVVARDKRRDVALLKADMEGLKPLYIQTEDVATGAEVFPVGAPMLEKLSGTISRGIASGYRRKSEGRVLQSDATIFGGNSGGPLVDGNGHVVAITVSGMQENGVPIGVNFFIPIADALKVLGIPARP
ncbi:S1C family serine protease [Nitratidesulfovibrio liaohensis]|uniref:S1C family serine protease n=1 Tax=Nitratidesulfovibrio liaohensis TaxID=2604158 RepID=UPI0014227D70|nr:S1C family serine protease [Nitratidesulfovibrio liaohensis]NHZ45351.1 trypsin-like peptidase domain-containing protein [Nitratidesulfovibrio liaohensis]